MAILTFSGRAALAKAVAAKPIHLAWGAGAASWDTTPVPEDVSATALVAEIGRREVTAWQYCVPDDNGTIVVPTGKFSPSATPTNHLYLRFNFDFNDAAADTIREVAVFSDSKMVAGLPAGQKYFAPAEVQDPGIMLVVERFPKFNRSNAVRQSFEFVVTI